jgi:hypothetical protein
VLLRAETSDPQGIDINEICARRPLSSNTIYPIASKLVSARWGNRRPETPQSRRSRAGPREGGPPHMRYSLTGDGHSAAVHELTGYFRAEEQEVPRVPAALPGDAAGADERPAPARIRPGLSTGALARRAAASGSPQPGSLAHSPPPGRQCQDGS